MMKNYHFYIFGDYSDQFMSLCANNQFVVLETLMCSESRRPHGHYLVSIPESYDMEDDLGKLSDTNHTRSMMQSLCNQTKIGYTDVNFLMEKK
jgi:hypothetical protein